MRNQAQRLRSLRARVIRGAMDGAAFAACMGEVLVPETEPGTVVICDNSATPKR